MVLLQQVALVFLSMLFGGIAVSLLLAKRLRAFSDREWREFVEGVERVRRELGGTDAR